MINTKPAISIIVPVYKTEKYVAHCLESLINQTFQDIEIICVNDGSPDNAPAICEEYAKKDNRIILLSQTNQGLSAARNTALAKAKGEYIQFCDSDDYYDINMCKKLHEEIIKTGADLVEAGINVLYENMPAQAEDPYYQPPFEGTIQVEDETFKLTNVFVWNKIFKKQILDQYSIVFPHGLHYEDANFVFKYLMVSKSVCFIKDQLYNYLCRPNSIMAQTQLAMPFYAIDHVYIIQDVAYFMEQNKLFKKYEQIFCWMILVYTNLACKYGGNKIYKQIFAAGSELIKKIDLNAAMEGNFNRDEEIQLFALKKNIPELFFSTICTKEDVLIKRNRNLFGQLVKSCVLFPWYIYKIYFMLYNKTLPVCKMWTLLRAYIFFPYYVLKTYLTLERQTLVY